MEPILEVSQLTMDFGGLRALDHLDLAINQGEIVALIGYIIAGLALIGGALYLVQEYWP